MVGKEACYNALTFRTKKAAGLSGSPETNLTFFFQVPYLAKPRDLNRRDLYIVQVRFNGLYSFRKVLVIELMSSSGNIMFNYSISSS